jgi:hypothetical protein
LRVFFFFAQIFSVDTDFSFLFFSFSVLSRGQVRHLPYPLHWDKCFGGACPAPGTYQNGAFWSTPLPYLVAASLNTGHVEFARRVVHAAVHDFELNGIYECVDSKETISNGVLNYTASASSVLWSVRAVVENN